MMNSEVHLKQMDGTKKFGLKGRGATAWLEQQLPALPDGSHRVCEIGNGELVARLDAAEFLLELSSESTSRFENALNDLPPDAYRVPRSEVTFLLEGPAAKAVLRQSCAVNLAENAPNQVVFTRIAGVSCAVVLSYGVESRYRMWIDYSYAPYLWVTLSEIVSDLGGTAVRQSLTPSLASA